MASLPGRWGLRLTQAVAEKRCIRKEAAAAGRFVSRGPYLDSLFILHFSLPLKVCGGEDPARLVA